MLISTVCINREYIIWIQCKYVQQISKPNSYKAKVYYEMYQLIVIIANILQSTELQE